MRKMETSVYKVINLFLATNAKPNYKYVGTYKSNNIKMIYLRI